MSFPGQYLKYAQTVVYVSMALVALLGLFGLGSIAVLAQPNTAQTEVLIEDNSVFGIDIANRKIEINAGFNGANILIFGAINRGKVIITIEGKLQDYQIRKKNRISGIWVNNEFRNIPELPNFYVLASSPGALEEINRQGELVSRLGFDNLLNSVTVFDEQGRGFYRAFVDLKQQRQLYQYLPDTITIANSGLFRVNVSLPAEISPGNYSIRAFSLDQGKIIQTYETALTIRKVGFGAQIYRFAHEHPYWYGIGAVIISVLSGLLANVLFGRKKQ